MTDTTKNEKGRKQPDLYFYVKVPNGRDRRIGSRIGVGFYHGDQKGINVILDAQPIPVDGTIELVGFPPKENG